MNEAKTLEEWGQDTNKHVKRGCGTRAEDSLYICVDASPLGKPIEYFLVDPAVPWNGGQLRAPMLWTDPEETVHIILGIGKTYYPFVSDFVEEARRFGVSKRIPRNFQVERLTPGKSRLLLVHPRAIPNFNYEAECTCPTRNRKPHECVGSLWSLSSLKEFKNVHNLKNRTSLGTVLVNTPSCWYEVTKAKKPRTFVDRYTSGAILRFPMFHLEYVNSEGRVPAELKKHIEKAKFTLDVVPA